jgi:hypothetical protein
MPSIPAAKREEKRIKEETRLCRGLSSSDMHRGPASTCPLESSLARLPDKKRIWTGVCYPLLHSGLYFKAAELKRSRTNFNKIQNLNRRSMQVLKYMCNGKRIDH